MAMTAAQKQIVLDNAGLTAKMAEYIIEHSAGHGAALTANAFWAKAFGCATKPANVSGGTKAVFLAAVKAGVDAIQ